VQGGSIAKMATRPLSPLPDLLTAPLTPAKARKLKPALWAGVVVTGVLLLGLGVARLASRGSNATAGPAPSPAPPPAAQANGPPESPRADSIRATPKLRAASPVTGKLRLLTSPPGAEILIDGRHVGVGSVFDLPLAAGPRQLEVRAPGYGTFDTTVVVEVGGTLSLGRITLRGHEPQP